MLIEQNELSLTEVIIFFSYSFCFFNINYHQSCLLIVYNEVYRPFAIVIYYYYCKIETIKVSVSLFNNVTFLS